MIDVIIKRKRCPFCGCEETELQGFAGVFWIWCESCGTCGPHGRTEQGAKESWNRRPLEDEAFSEGMCAEARDE